MKIQAWIAPASLGMLLVAGVAAAFEPAEVRECHQVLVVAENPDDEEVATQVAKFTCRKVEELQKLFGLDDQQEIHLLICASMNRWFELTGTSFYTVGVASSNGNIVLQPAKSLRKLGNTNSMLVHELTHLMVDRAAGRNCPHWLNEGLAQYFEGVPPRGGAPANEEQLKALEARWLSPKVSVAQRREDYRMSVVLVHVLAEQVGIEKLLRALPDLMRVPDPLALDIEGESMRDRLFSKERRKDHALPEGAIPDNEDGSDDEAGITPLPWLPKKGR